MARYKYTVDNGIFSEEQREFYEKNGYIMYRKLISDKDLDLCQQQFVDICDGKVDTSGMTVMKDYVLAKQGGAKGQYLINKIQEFLYNDLFFEKYASNPDVINVVKSVIGANVVAIHSMLINKPPDSNYDFSRHPTHQDLHYFPLRPADRIVAAWTAMENINEENGCLYAVPGSHHIDRLFPHVYPDIKNKMYHEVLGFEYLPRVNLVMEKGDTVFFHPLLLHGSGPNRTKGFRKAISVHYSDSFCKFIDVKGTTQENIAAEIEELAFKKSGIRVRYTSIWKYKSRLVSGVIGNFQERATSRL